MNAVDLSVMVIVSLPCWPWGMCARLDRPAPGVWVIGDAYMRLGRDYVFEVNT